MVVKKIRKGKKQWFKVEAEFAGKKSDLGEITAYELKELLGRRITIPLSTVTQTMRDSSKKLGFKIFDIRGQTAIAEADKYNLQDGYVQRVSRRHRSRYVVAVSGTAQDKKQVKLKLYVLAVKPLPRKIGAALITKLNELVLDMIKKSPSADFFAPQSIDKIQIMVAKELRQIYPLDKVLIWKVSLV